MKNSGTVRFLLNGRHVQIDFHKQSGLSPTTTLLEYLRNNPDLQGTKEGCAEGDCGACTVVMVNLFNKGSEVRAIDSCLVFLPMVHGKAIITVEHIGKLDQLHPVQQSMVDADGSQCGYCTPGFIMSMFALHANHHSPSRSIVFDALTGNLCRCTGYRSIVEAAETADGKGKQISQEIITNTTTELSRVERYPLNIVQENQKYFQPLVLEDALRFKNMYPAAILINGATDVGLKVTKNDELLPVIIDLSNIDELQVFNSSNDSCTFGSGLSLEKVNQLAKQTLPAVSECLAVFGSLQIRNLATIGGNIASASPIGDLIPILMAYSADIGISSNGSNRVIPLTEFITGYRETRLEPNELITSIRVPLPKPTTFIKWYKISKRRDLDISTVSGGFLLELDSDSRVIEIALYFGGMAEKISVAGKTMALITGMLWDMDTIQQASLILEKEFTPISDARATADGRQIMARNLLWKFWLETHAK